MMNREKEAIELVKKAESKMNTGFFGSIFSSKSSRMEEALDYLEKAANIFKLVKNWEEAGKTYEKCGNIELELQADASKYYLDAAHCYSFVNLQRCAEIKKKALEIYKQQGRFQLAGKIQKEMAEKFEEEREYKQAAEAFKAAADYFSMESMNSKSYQQSCLLKYADLLCIMEDAKPFPEAADVSLLYLIFVDIRKNWFSVS